MSGAPLTIFQVAGRAMSAQLTRMNTTASNLANAGGVFEAAVDESRELVDMMETARTYQNNVEVMQTAKTLILDTLKMGR